MLRQPGRQPALKRRGLLWLVPLAMALIAVAIPLAAEPPAPLDRRETPDGVAYGLTIGRRRAFFRDIAANDVRWRMACENAFPGDPWAQADHWTDLMAGHVRWMAESYRVSVVPILLAYDEGLHEGWKTPSNHTLRTTFPPLPTHKR